MQVYDTRTGLLHDIDPSNVSGYWYFVTWLEAELRVAGCESRVEILPSKHFLIKARQSAVISFELMEQHCKNPGEQTTKNLIAWIVEMIE